MWLMSPGVKRFARTDHRNDDCAFGIKDEDRFSHIYIIGKTGTGKSTLIETMALQDIERGAGSRLLTLTATWWSASRLKCRRGAHQT